MGNYYNQLSNDERSLIYRWYHCGNKSIREIARLLDRSHSTISREIKRHEMPSCGAGTKLSYFPRVAAHNAAMTKRERGRGMRLKNDQTRTYVIEKLKEGWSPEIIAGRLRGINRDRQLYIDFPDFTLFLSSDAYPPRRSV